MWSVNIGKQEIHRWHSGTVAAVRTDVEHSSILWSILTARILLRFLMPCTFEKDGCETPDESQARAQLGHRYIAACTLWSLQLIVR